MIPRLPPLILALLGGGAIYGIKYTLDKFEPKALGAPGSTEHYERVLKYRQNVKRLGIAASCSGVLYASYLGKNDPIAYQARNERSMPASIKHDQEGFYQDQYSSREKNFALQKQALDKERQVKDTLAQQYLEQEVKSMENVIRNNK